MDHFSRDSQLIEFENCIEGDGSRHSGGYRVRNIGGRVLYQHRLAWEALYGAIPEGLVLHHRCRNQACVNVDHLELMTLSAHTRLHHPPIVVCPKCGGTERRIIRTRAPKTYCVTCVRERDRLRRAKELLSR